MTENFAPVETIGGANDCGILLLCDHARNALPAEYGLLGLPESAFQRHIAYDIGAREVALGLARELSAPAVLTTWSRLLIDPNRGEDDPTLVMRISDGAIVPGNHRVETSEIERRLERFHRPYHRAVAARIDTMMATGKPPAIFSVHSFTPAWKSVRRPWDVALLWDSDPRMSGAMLAELRAVAGLVVGDNEPYDGALRNDTMFRHCTIRGLAHALIEIRQDLIADAAGVGRWVGLLAPMLRRVNALEQIHEVRHFGSRTGPAPAQEATS